MRGRVECSVTYSDVAAVANDGDDRVVRLRTACCRIDYNKHDRAVWHWQRLQRHCNLDVAFSENLLKTVKRQPCKFGLDQVWPVLHHDFELPVSLFALPHRNQVKHVNALGLFAILLAPLTA